jgi:hypothetical protein
MAGIVAPLELALAGLELDGAGGAAKAADGAAGAERGIEAHQSAEALAHLGARREEQCPRTAPEILPQHGKDVHDLNLIKSADEMARTAKIRVHCQ